MEKIIRLQDAKFKILPNNNNETSIFIEQSIASSLGLSDGVEHVFSIDKENVKKQLQVFKNHLIEVEEQKNKTSEVKQHFKNWLSKQDLSAFKTKPDYIPPVQKANQEHTKWY